MRLAEQEVKGLIDALSCYLEGNAAELYLYGSRVDDTKKGGDIDLFIKTSSEVASVLNAKKHLILAEMKTRIDDQKIDLSILAPELLVTDPFWKGVSAEAILLHAWHGV